MEVLVCGKVLPDAEIPETCVVVYYGGGGAPESGRGMRDGEVELPRGEDGDGCCPGRTGVLGGCGCVCDDCVGCKSP